MAYVLTFFSVALIFNGIIFTNAQEFLSPFPANQQFPQDQQFLQVQQFPQDQQFLQVQQFPPNQPNVPGRVYNHGECLTCPSIPLEQCKAQADLEAQQSFYCTGTKVDEFLRRVTFQRCPAPNCPPGFSIVSEQVGPSKSPFPQCCAKCQKLTNPDGTIPCPQEGNIDQCCQFASELSRQQDRCIGFIPDIFGKTISVKQCPPVPNQCPPRCLIPERTGVNKPPFPQCCGKCLYPLSSFSP